MKTFKRLGLICIILALCAVALTACSIKFDVQYGNKNAEGNELPESTDDQTDAQATSHTHETVSVSSPATCTESGISNSIVCVTCGETVSEGETVPAIGHITRTIVGTPATCTENGKTSLTKCSVCDEIISESAVIYAVGHRRVNSILVTPTCTESGKTAGSYCSTCGMIFDGMETIPAMGHNEVAMPDVAPTCNIAGRIGGSYCSICNDILKSQETLPPTEDHTYSANKCTVCGKMYVPSGIAITSSNEFLNMDPYGSYYLATDLTLNKSYIKNFEGKFDGNGHTVTVSNPLFTDFSGEVKNLTINGNIYYIDSDAAAFAVCSSKGFKATNCINNANVTVTGNAQYAAGFVGIVEDIQEPCVFKNCTNNGNIEIITNQGIEKPRAGGFGGIINSVVLYSCTNNGNIHVNGNLAIVGGLVGRIATQVGTCQAQAFNCTNNGNITVEETYVNSYGSYSSGGSDAGGIFGYVGGPGNTAWYQIWGCTNNGDIDAPFRVGGMAGYVYASGSTAFVDVQFCVNTGDLTYGRTKDNGGASQLYDYCSPFVAYSNSAFTTIKYCIDTGSVTLRPNALTLNSDPIFIGCSSADSTQYDISHVYVINKSQFKFYSWASAESNASQRIEIGFAEGIKQTTYLEIRSGSVATAINAAAPNDPYGSASPYFSFGSRLGTNGVPVIVFNESAFRNSDMIYY